MSWSQPPGQPFAALNTPGQRRGSMRSNSRNSLAPGIQSPNPLAATGFRRASVLQTSFSGPAANNSMVPGQASASIEPGLFLADVGDRVTVPGGYQGTVQYVGPVAGREGIFLGIDLDAAFAGLGRNDGTHAGNRYFNTHASKSGLFAPQGKCQVLETIRKRESQVSAGGTKHPLHVGTGNGMTQGNAGQQAQTQEQLLGLGPPPGQAAHGRAASRTYNVRPESRLQTHATPDIPSGPSRSVSQDLTSQQAQQYQQLLNDKARLQESLSTLQERHDRLERAKAVQAQEMEEMMGTVRQLEAFLEAAGPQPQGSTADSLQNSSEEDVAALQAALAERDAKIDQLREEAADRRREFRDVTAHQAQTIDQLKSLHEARIAAMEEQRTDLEERLLSSAGTEQVNTVEMAQSVEALERMCDELQRGSDQAKEAMDAAHGRIAELEAENARLHEEVIVSRTAAVADKTPRNSTGRLVKRSSLDKLPPDHPQRVSAFGMLEGEVARLEQENALLKRTAAQKEQVAHASLAALQRELQQAQQAQQDGGYGYGTDADAELAAALEDERAQRLALQDRYADLERQLEDTILQIEQASLPARAASRSTVSPTLSIRVPKPVGTPDPVRSPRPPPRQSVEQMTPVEGPLDLDSEGHGVCEYCGQAGHDMLSCKDVFGTPPTLGKIQMSQVNGHDSRDTERSQGLAATPIRPPAAGGVSRIKQLAGQEQQPDAFATPPRKDASGQLWCSCCHRYGPHGTEDCPDADEQF